MKRGCISEYFSGVAAKVLSAVEADLVRSHQHEFNGVDGLKKIFGQAIGKQKFAARFLYLRDDREEPIVSDGFLTWYDAREQHPTRSEHRLYFPTTQVSLCATEGDLLVIGRHQGGAILVVIAEGGSTIANQISWLFGLSTPERARFAVKTEAESDHIKLVFVSKRILEAIGVELIETVEATDYLDQMLKKFGGFPSTKLFSTFARETLPALDSRDDPDAVLLAWMDREEMLFRALERYMIADRIQKGFGGDVDDFITFSLSVQNRRKSRAGSALEHHVEEIFLQHGIRYDRGKVTENRSKPDFIFPSIAAYHSAHFPVERLSMLGVKLSCKERWRQVLAEAQKITCKCLLTLEPAISAHQTDEMKNSHLSLVLPASIHSSYTQAQRGWLLTLEELVATLLDKQSA